jgi:hypothetical protein
VAAAHPAAPGLLWPVILPTTHADTLCLLATYCRAEVYYAYNMIYRTITSPFRTLPATTTFNAAVFLVMRLVSREPPPGVSLSTVLYLLGKQCMHAGAHKLARFAYNKLQTMVLPPAWQQEVDLQSLLVRWAAAGALHMMAPVLCDTGTCCTFRTWLVHWPALTTRSVDDA